MGDSGEQTFLFLQTNYTKKLYHWKNIILEQPYKMLLAVKILHHLDSIYLKEFEVEICVKKSRTLEYFVA